MTKSRGGTSRSAVHAAKRMKLSADLMYSFPVLLRRPAARSWSSETAVDKPSILAVAQADTGSRPSFKLDVGALAQGISENDDGE